MELIKSDIPPQNMMEGGGRGSIVAMSGPAIAGAEGEGKSCCCGEVCG